MRGFFIAFAFLLATAGCATTNQGRATQVVMASDAFADEVDSGWSQFVDAKIEKCRAELPSSASEAQRRECMGLAGQGDKLEAALASLIAAQRAVTLAVHCDSNPAQVPAQFVGQCVTGQTVDWGKLLVDVQVAWSEVRPFFEEMKRGVK